MNIISNDPRISISGFEDSLHEQPPASPPSPNAPPISDVAVPSAAATSEFTMVTSTTATVIIDTPQKTTIERTSHPDGSLAVQVTTIALRQDGHREVRTEHYHVPPEKDATEATLLDIESGTDPSNLYLKTVDWQILPPGTEAAVAKLPPPCYEATCIAKLQLDKTEALIISCAIVVALAIGVGLAYYILVVEPFNKFHDEVNDKIDNDVFLNMSGNELSDDVNSNLGNDDFLNTWSKEKMKEASRKFGNGDR